MKSRDCDAAKSQGLVQGCLTEPSSASSPPCPLPRCPAATGLRQPAPDGEEGAEQTYAILLADTVVVRGGGQSPEVATIAASKDWEEVAYFLNDDEEEEEAEGEGGSGGKGGGRTLQPLDPQDLAGRRSQRTEQVDFRLRDEERCVRGRGRPYGLWACTGGGAGLWVGGPVKGRG